MPALEPLRAARLGRGRAGAARAPAVVRQPGRGARHDVGLGHCAFIFRVLVAASELAARACTCPPLARCAAPAAGLGTFE